MRIILLLASVLCSHASRAQSFSFALPHQYPDHQWIKIGTEKIEFMTASQMQDKVIQLTGVYHAGFEENRSTLGFYDTSLGVRTNKSPTFTTVRVLAKIAPEVAKAAILRDIFVDQDKKLLFGDLDLTASPVDSTFKDQVNSLYLKWFGYPLDPEQEILLLNLFRSVEKSKSSLEGYQKIIEILIQNHALYYY